MAHAAYIRAKAREMRVDRRLTLDQIAERLALPRTAIYYWVRDLPVPPQVTHGGPLQAARRRGNRAMQKKHRLLREEAYRVDRLSEARMVPRTGLDSTASGRSEAWYRAAFGEPRPPVRIRAPRLFDPYLNRRR
jgi:hypothetical protein